MHALLRAYNLTSSRSHRLRQCKSRAKIFTLFDAAALASTAPLDLSDASKAPDFISLSYYKIFGFPDIGALLVRKESANMLTSRKYFGGGTVEMVTMLDDHWHAKKESSIHDRLEDGTLPFHSIFALDTAMTVHERLYGPDPMKFISAHTTYLGKELHDGLLALRHANGQPVITIYNDSVAVYGDAKSQGATVAFNVRRADGVLVGYQEVEKAADERRLYVRSGSLCNPGGIAKYLDWSPMQMKAAYAAGHRCSDPTQVVFGKPTGVVRVTLGATSVLADVTAFLHFIQEAYVEKHSNSVPRIEGVVESTPSVPPKAIRSGLKPFTIKGLFHRANRAKPNERTIGERVLSRLSWQM